MTHDPMAAPDTPAEPPHPDPWASLAAQACALAAFADRCATLAPADLAPTETDDADAGVERGDLLAELDARALAVRSVAAACRRATWQALADDGMSLAEIGRTWGVTRATVHNALKQTDRPR